MPPYVYVKIIWRITSYSTLFILKRNTCNCFYLLSYVCLSGIFLENVHQKTLFRTTPFRLFTRSRAIFFSGVNIQTTIHSQTLPAHWKWRWTAYQWEAWLIEARILEVLLCKQCLMILVNRVKYYFLEIWNRFKNMTWVQLSPSR
jgi:hypothetical protein